MVLLLTYLQQVDDSIQTTLRGQYNIFWLDLQGIFQGKILLTTLYRQRAVPRTNSQNPRNANREGEKPRKNTST